MVDGSVHSVCNLISIRPPPTLVDIHRCMPGFAEDRGGNSVDVRFNGRKENLHSLWDTVLVELEQGTPAEIAQRIQAMVSSNEVQQWRQGTQ